MNVHLIRAYHTPINILDLGLVHHETLCRGSFVKVCIEGLSVIHVQNVDEKKKSDTHLASTACRPCPTTSATYAISTTEYGSTIRRRFCSSRVSYSAARCERIVGSDESSGRRRRLGFVRRERRERRTNHLCTLSTPARIRRGSAPDVHVQWRAYFLPRGVVCT